MAVSTTTTSGNARSSGHLTREIGLVGPLHVALSTEKIEEMVNRVVVPEEGEAAPLPAH